MWLQIVIRNGTIPTDICVLTMFSNNEFYQRIAEKISTAVISKIWQTIK